MEFPLRNLSGLPVWFICEETVTLTVRALSSGRDSWILAPVHYSFLLRHDSDLDQMVKKRRKKNRKFRGQRGKKRGGRKGKLTWVEGNLDGLHG